MSDIPKSSAESAEQDGLMSEKMHHKMLMKMSDVQLGLMITDLPSGNPIRNRCIDIFVQRHPDEFLEVMEEWEAEQKERDKETRVQD